LHEPFQRKVDFTRHLGKNVNVQVTFKTTASQLPPQLSSSLSALSKRN